MLLLLFFGFVLHQFSFSHAAAIELVLNDFGVPIGQVVGNPFYVQNANVSQTVCTTIFSDIELFNPDFTVDDFIASYNNVTLSDWLNIQINANETEWCAELQQTGFYFPILRVSNPSNYTYDNDIVQTSSLTTGVIIGIVCACVGVVGSVIALYYFLLNSKPFPSMRERSRV